MLYIIIKGVIFAYIKTIKTKIMWDREGIRFGYNAPKLKTQEKTFFETGREARRRIRKENRKSKKF